MNHTSVCTALTSTPALPASASIRLDGKNGMFPLGPELYKTLIQKLGWVTDRV